MNMSTQKSQLASALLFVLNFRPASALIEIENILNGIDFVDCDTSLYYDSLHALQDDPLQWTPDALHALVKASHRNIVPSNAEEWENEDTYAAVLDLDRGAWAGTVHLIYSDLVVNATPQANIWEVERLWPLHENYSRAEFSAYYTDVHHLRPIDVAVLAGKNTSSFGMCNTVASIATCTIPATASIGWDTAQDEKIWQPPQSNRGAIARALFYMDLRYDFLTLVDCDPDLGHGQLGYVSQLLQWHRDFPPDKIETQRNNRACSRWQGNRNPFVDYPQLAELLHGIPQELTINGTYPSCIDTNKIDESLPGEADSNITGYPYYMRYTASPSDSIITEDPSLWATSSPSVDSDESDPCLEIGRGSLPFFLVNSLKPDEIILVALEKIAGGMELYLTDQAWDGNGLAKSESDEGTVVMTTPEDGITEGFLFGYGPQAALNERWTKDQGAFSLGNEGDNIFLYCLDGSNQIRFLSGFSNGGNWKAPFLDFADYGYNGSALPESLVNASLALPHLYNYHYNGPRDDHISSLRKSIIDPLQWKGSNQTQYRIGGFRDSEDKYERSSSETFPPRKISFLILATCLFTLFILN